MTEKKVYNRLFTYARIAFKKTPRMYQYINWIGDQWQEWDKETGNLTGTHTKENYIKFDKWLYEKLRAGK
jgi:hypothetical protein